MKAVQVTELAGPDGVEIVEVEAPRAGAGEVLVRVEAAGVTFPELLQTRGMYQVSPTVPFTLGSEFAGVVHEAGEGSGFSPGDRVAGLFQNQAWAEYAVGDAETVVPIPDSLDVVLAAGMPMNLLTVDFALRVRGNLQPGQTLLVHGAAGGLGSALVQLGTAMGAQVIAVTSTEEKAAIARKLGAHTVVMAEGFKDAVRAQFPKGVDLVADPVGGDRFTDSLRCLATYGTLLVLGFTAGSIPEVKVNRLLLNNISVAGVGWGAAIRGRAGYIDEQWQHLLPHIESGALNPHIHAVYPLADAARALREMDSRAVLGKIVLTP